MRYLKIFFSKSFIKFIFLGALITFTSNSILLLFLLILPLGIATFLTQIIHAFLGYLSNKYITFKSKGRPFTYSFLVILSWIMQWLLIKTIIYGGIDPMLAVLIAIPFLAIFSFITQKFLIFK